jgi:hypothetical protein
MRTLMFLILYAAPALWAQGPTVYISGDNGVSGSSSGFAFGGIAGGGSTVEKKDKTTAMAHILLKSCPELSLTVDKESVAKPDYLMLLHSEEGDYGSTRNEVMVLRPDQSIMFASKNESVARATRDGCKVIMADWRDRRLRTGRSDRNSNWNTTTPTPKPSN